LRYSPKCGQFCGQFCGQEIPSGCGEAHNNFATHWLRPAGAKSALEAPYAFARLLCPPDGRLLRALIALSEQPCPRHPAKRFAPKFPSRKGARVSLG